MDLPRLIERLACFPASLHALLGGMREEDARWKPPSGNWSILEIVCHLADEEAEDFRPRVESTLRDPGEAWKRIDPERAAAERRYNERKLGDSLHRFAAERTASVAWLRSLRNPDWTTTYAHAQFGPLRAGDLMAAWAAHDALHLRQIAKRMYELTKRDAFGFEVGYAGEWRS